MNPAILVIGGIIFALARGRRQSVAQTDYTSTDTQAWTNEKPSAPSGSGRSYRPTTPDASMANAPASSVPEQRDRWRNAQALLNQARSTVQLRLSNTPDSPVAARVAMSSWPELATDGQPGPQTLSAIQSLYAIHRSVLPFDPWSAAPPVSLSDLQGAATDVTRGRVVAVASSLLRWARAAR